ncbi:MAG: glycosyltransferase family 39 protein [Acidobacteriota bacterium]
MTAHSSATTSSEEQRRALPVIVLETLLVAMLIIGFTALAAFKIGFYPAPWKDEPWLMQPAYEVTKQGQMCLPMFRHFDNEVGNQIFTDPVFTYLLAGWFRIYGFGMTEARLFNLALSAGVLLLVYLIARQLGGHMAGLVALALLIFDNNYFTGSRFLRNDFAAIFFALAAVCCYLRGRKQGHWYWFLAAGASAAMSLLSHLNGIYVIALLGLWLLRDHGWRIVKTRTAWLTAAGVLMLAAPYTAYCLAHKETYLAQWQLFTPGRARGLTSGGLWKNISQEPARYRNWQYGVLVLTENRAVGFFQTATVLALLYLLATVLVPRWRGSLTTMQARSMVLIATLWCAFFFASEVSNKTHSYLPHLTTWFALSIGVAIDNLARLIDRQQRFARLLIMVLSVVAFAYLYYAAVPAIKYYKYVRTLTPIGQEQTEQAFRAIIGPDLVPLGSPRHWHLFAARDDYRAFSRPLSRRILTGDFGTEQFAMIVNNREKRKFLAVAEQVDQPARQFSLLAQLPDTPYGPLWIYYIGNDLQYLNKPARQF